MPETPFNTDTTMRETSFGSMGAVIKHGKKPVAEYLVFTKAGKAHKHKEYETFTVLSGTGQVYVGERKFSVSEGSIVTIPPMVPHWMEPEGGGPLEGLLWYHHSPASHKT